MKFKHTSKTKWISTLLISPFLIFFIIFRVVPTGFTVLMSLNLDQNRNFNFSLNNYFRLTSDLQFLQSIGNTLIILGFSLFIMLPIILVLSTQIIKIKSQSLILGIFIIPTFIGVFAFAIIFRYMFTYNGVINQMISITKIDWFGNPLFAQLMIAIALSWISIGYLLLIYTNSLKSIPKYYYEAFSIESKSYIQRLFSVQIPLTLPALKSILFMICLEVFSLIDLPLNLTEGAPQNSTVTTAYYIYKTSIEYFDFNYAATISILFMVCCFVIFLIKPAKEEYYEMV